ncbi:unnamed protein product [Closterium sp. NIES-64]|nr:unnamed protein product [Closterium sp. NIES-64]
MSSRRFAQGAADAQQRLEGPADLSVASTRSLAAHTPSPFPSPPLRLPTGRGPTRPEQDEDPPEQVEAKIQQLLQLVLECRRFGKAGGNSQTAAAGTATDAAAVAEAAAVAAAAGAVRVRGGGLGTGRGGLVVHSGAGLSTAAGIPDFRGPKGVWTLQGEGRWEEAAAAMGRKYEEASPTVGHMAVAALVRAGIVQHVVTQNGWWGGYLFLSLLSHFPLTFLSLFTHFPLTFSRFFLPFQSLPSHLSLFSRSPLTSPQPYLSQTPFQPLITARPYSRSDTPPPPNRPSELHGSLYWEMCQGSGAGWISQVKSKVTSPLPPNLPSELHGSVYRERCQGTAFSRVDGITSSCLSELHGWSSGVPFPLTSLSLPLYPYSSPSTFPPHQWTAFTLEAASHQGVSRSCMDQSGIPSDSLSELHGWWSGVPFPLTSLSLPIYPYSLPSTFPPTVDGLHSRSGIPSHRLSELHGSVYRESCRECGAGYVRPFDPRSSAAVRARMSAGGGGGVKEENREVLVGEGRKRHEPGKASFELTQKSAQMSTGGGGYVKEENQEVLLGERRKWREPGAATLEDSEGIPRAMVRDYHKEGDYARMEDEEGVRRWRETEEKQQREGGGKNEEVTRVCEGRGAQEEEQAEVTKGGEEREEEGGEERHEGGAVCGGELVDSIVHFGERIDDEELRTAREASMGAHVALCLGSSFKVRLSGGGPFKVRD